MRLLLILPLLMGCPTPDSVESRLKVLEAKALALEAENTELMQRLDRIEEEHIRCAMCETECESAKEAMLALKDTLSGVDTQYAR